MNDSSPCSDLDRLARSTSPDAFDVAMQKHVATCAACAGEKAGAEALDSLLVSLGEGVTCPPGVVAAVLESVGPKRVDRAAVRPPRRAPWGRIGAVALALLLVASSAWMLSSALRSPIEGPMAVAPAPTPAPAPIVPAVPEPDPVASPTSEAPAQNPAPTGNAAPAQAATAPSAAPSPVVRRALPTPEAAPQPIVAEAPPDSSAIAAEQVYIALAIVGRTQARAEATLIEEVQRVESAVRVASPF